MKNVRGTDSPGQSIQLAGLALVTQDGHSTEPWPKGQLIGSLPYTGIPCQRSLLLAGFLGAVVGCWDLWEWWGFAMCSVCPCGGTTSVCLSPWLQYVMLSVLCQFLSRYSQSLAAAIRIPQDRLTHGRGEPCTSVPVPSLGDGL